MTGTMTVVEFEFLRDVLKRASLGASSVAKTGSGQRAWTFGILACGTFRKIHELDSPTAEALSRCPGALARALEIIADARALAKVGDTAGLAALLDFPQGNKREVGIREG